MTEQEKMDFLNKVKGRKIRWGTWPQEWYFIPFQIGVGNELVGSFFIKKTTTQDDTILIGSGSKNTINNLIGKWEYVNDFRVGDIVGDKTGNYIGDYRIEAIFEQKSHTSKPAHAILKYDIGGSHLLELDYLELISRLIVVPQSIDKIEVEIELSKPKCLHLNRYKNIVSKSLKFWSCCDCGEDLGDILDTDL